MKINSQLIKDYEQLQQTTNLQEAYQEFIKLFHSLHIHLSKAFPDYAFAGNIVENGMDYSYFHFTNEHYKKLGLKFVVTYLHKEGKFNIWLSGYNRKIQEDFTRELRKKDFSYTLTTDPNRTDYILKNEILADRNYERIESEIQDFINHINTLV